MRCPSRVSIRATIFDRVTTTSEGSSMAVLPWTSQDERLQLAYLNLFDDCNVRCNMCDCWQLPRPRRSGADYLEALELVLGQRPAAIRFTGGEPLLLRTLPDLVRRAAVSGARVSVITNGRL